MNLYEDVFRVLELPKEAYEIAIGESVLQAEPCGHFLPFPPALIPFASDDFGYQGFWKHWFCDRRMSVVRLECDDHIVASEEGQSFLQYAMIQALQYICGDVLTEKEAWEYLHSLGLTCEEFEEGLAIIRRTGDEQYGFLEHSRVRCNPPLMCFEEESRYPGDFPVAQSLISHPRKDVCGFEVPVEVLIEMQQTAQKPWLAPPGGPMEQRRVFEVQLDRGDLAGAWLSLNSPVWLPEDAKTAMTRLADKAEDEAFSILARAWISTPQGVLG